MRFTADRCGWSCAARSRSVVNSTVDVIVIGAGPAGLSAALVLGRCRRRVIVIDSGEYRNATSQTMNGFLSRDGWDPAELRRVSREQLAKYPTVEVRQSTVTSADHDGRGGYIVRLASGDDLSGRVMVLASGVVDRLPDLAGADELFGRGVFQCPYCDAFEVADRRLVAYGRESEGVDLALELTTWSDDVVLCTDGTSDLSDVERDRLEANHIRIESRRIRSLVGGDRLRAVEFDDDSSLDCDALFFVSRQRQRSDLAARLGCQFTDGGAVATDEHEASCVPGLYVTGDASRDVQFAIVAAAEGAEAAAAINTALHSSELA